MNGLTWPGAVSTAITVGGLCAIALTTDDPETKAMAVGAIAGASQPLGAAAVTTLGYRGTGRGRRNTAERWATLPSGNAEFSDR